MKVETFKELLEGLIEKKEKLRAVKLVFNCTELGLKDSKELVDEFGHDVNALYDNLSGSSKAKIEKLKLHEII